MGQPAAKQGDLITAWDMHFVLVPGAGRQRVPHRFAGVIDRELSGNVNIQGKPAATVGSTATNEHVPIGGSFERRPKNKGTIKTGSEIVLINGKRAARHGDTALTCNDPVDLPVGTVVAAGTVLIG